MLKFICSGANCLILYQIISGFKEDGDNVRETESYEYDLIGVTVHTGTADGGHYYSFIRDIVNPHAYKNNKW